MKEKNHEFELIIKEHDEYTIRAEDPGSHKYEVYYEGELLNDVTSITRSNNMREANNLYSYTWTTTTEEETEDNWKERTKRFL